MIVCQDCLFFVVADIHFNFMIPVRRMLYGFGDSDCPLQETLDIVDDIVCDFICSLVVYIIVREGNVFAEPHFFRPKVQSIYPTRKVKVGKLLPKIYCFLFGRSVQISLKYKIIHGLNICFY
jgi:hypothetical protein